MSSFTPDGLILDRYPDIFDKLTADFRAAFGEGLKNTPDSIAGQIIALFSEVVSDQNELIEGVVNAHDPESALGIYLSKIVRFNGINRKEEVRSTVPLNLTANSAGSTVPAGSLFQDPDIQEDFALDSETVIAPSGTQLASATAVNPGPIAALAGTIDKIVTPVYGLESVDNPSDATPGQIRETDPLLRVRRTNAAQGAGSANVPAIRKKINDIDSVTAVKVVQNRTDETTVEGQPPHSVWCIVQGGTDQEVAQAIFESVNAGTDLFGSLTVPYYDAESGETYDINFSRPIQKNIYISVNITKFDEYPPAGDADMKQAIVDYFDGDFTIDGREVPGFSIADDIIYSRIFSPVNSIPSHSVGSLYIGLTPSPTGTADIPIATDEIGKTNVGIILVNGA
jgi:uncharacterized phage protein gp47/JayE